MNISDLQQHFADLARLLESAGSKSTAKELGALTEGLAPFKMMTLRAQGLISVREEWGRRTPASWGIPRRMQTLESRRASVLRCTIAPAPWKVVFANQPITLEHWLGWRYVTHLIALAPDIQEALLYLPRTECGRDSIQLRQLQPITMKADWREQRVMWQQLQNACL